MTQMQDRRELSTPALEARELTLAYGDRVVVSDLDLVVHRGSFTVIVGPNACGKSTLLRGLGRLHRPRSGTVLLDGRPEGDFGRRELARTMAFLPQSSIAPEGVTVAGLVARGRHPHQNAFQQWRAADAAAVDGALEATAIADLAGRPVAELSGGQRQRVWVAMALAQESPVILLDEPTTFLDITHQVDLLELFAELVATHGRTVVAVLHDLNQAARYGTDLVAMADGRIVAEGAPEQVITADLVSRVFDLESVVVDDPVEPGPLMVPTRRRRTSGTQTP